jgi:hypothetical protein
MSIFYEGMTLKWYNYVTILLLCTDGIYFIATVLNLLFNRNNKVFFYFNIFSVILIIVMLIMKFLKIEHPNWAVTFWYFYILYLYGIQVLIDILNIIRINKIFV